MGTQPAEEAAVPGTTRNQVPTDLPGPGLGWLMLLAALVIGIAGDYLFWHVLWHTRRLGLNLFLWVALVVLAVGLLARYGKVRLTGEGIWLALPLLYLAGAFAWRNSTLLLIVDFLVLLFTAALAVVYSRVGQIRLASPATYLLGAVSGAVRIAFSPFVLAFRDVNWKQLPGQTWSQTALRVLRGGLIALPLLFIFGGLFALADPMYYEIITDIFAIDISRFISDLLLIAFLAWIAAGILRATITGGEPDWSGWEKSTAGFSLGAVEGGTILVCLNTLFFSFVLVQLRYLFGGASLVQVSPGLTYAQYARYGFFELVTVAVLVLPLLLLIHWLMRDQDSRAQIWFKGLAAALVAMLFVVMASAWYRMRLYQQAYGQSELRFYVTAFMAWLAVVFLWFMFTVLRERRGHFVFGLLASGYLALFILHAINPDALVARANVVHYHQSGECDAYYLSCLSADAAPVLIESLPSLPEQAQGIVAQSLLHHGSPRPGQGDWRYWNWGRMRARSAVEEKRGMLEEMKESWLRELERRREEWEKEHGGGG